MRTVFGRLFTSYLTIIVFSLVALGASLSYLFAEYTYQRTEADLVQKGQELAYVTQDLFREGAWGFGGSPTDPYTSVYLMSYLDSFDRLVNARVWLVNQLGVVFMASPANESYQGFQLSTESVGQILRGETVAQRQEVGPLGEPTLTIAIPVNQARRVVGAVVLHTPLEGIAGAISQMQRLILAVLVFASVLAAGLSWVLSRRISKPLRQMTRIANEMAQGDFERRVTVSSRDEVGQLATAFNHLARELNESLNALSQEKSRMESVIVSMSEGVIAVDRSCRILLANPPAVELTRHARNESLSPSNYVGQSLHTLWPDRRVHDCFERSMAELAPQTLEIEERSRVLRVHIGPVRGIGADSHGAVALVQDVSEHWRLERMRRDFVANVSHELRTPLTSLRGFLQALVDGMAPDRATEQRYHQLMLDECMRLIRLVNSLLDLSRIEGGSVQLQLRPVDVREIVTRVLETLAPTVGDKQIAVEKAFEADLPLVRADYDRLSQVLLNVLDNATRYTPERGTIRIRAEACDGMVRIAVVDSGPGIPPDQLPHIWERFYKVDKARRLSGGTGLGLVIVKQLTELHGGRVGASSAVGVGTEIAVEIPASAAFASAAGETRPTTPPNIQVAPPTDENEPPTSAHSAS